MGVVISCKISRKRHIDRSELRDSPDEGVADSTLSGGHRQPADTQEACGFTVWKAEHGACSTSRLPSHSHGGHLLARFSLLAARSALNHDGCEELMQTSLTCEQRGSTELQSARVTNGSVENVYQQISSTSTTAFCVFVMFSVKKNAFRIEIYLGVDPVRRRLKAHHFCRF